MYILAVVLIIEILLHKKVYLAPKKHTPQLRQNCHFFRRILVSLTTTDKLGIEKKELLQVGVRIIVMLMYK